MPERMINTLLLIIGILILLKGADYLVKGSSSLAKKIGVPSLAIGLTLLAFGTSMPELIVNIVAAIKGNENIAFGNVIGSNIANILLVIGTAALITNLKVKPSTTWIEIPISFLAVCVLFIFAHTLALGGYNKHVDRIEGIILIIFFILFIYYVFKLAKKKKVKLEEEIKIEKLSYKTIILMIVLGIAGLYFGGKWTVEGAIGLARLVGISEYFISLTIVAIGTSLPELITSIVAALRKEADLVLGNVVGSNVFNVFLVLGISSIIIPIRMPTFAIIDLIFLLIITLLLIAFIYLGKKHEIVRWQGVFFIMAYFLYLIYLVSRRSYLKFLL